MLTIDPLSSTLVVIDIQSKLMPVIQSAEVVTLNSRRLIDAANLLDIDILFTEQNAKGLGSTVSQLPVDTHPVIHKMTFDACRVPDFLEKLDKERAVLVVGCETHVCVQQTVLGLLENDIRTYVVTDATGSRRTENKEAALQRMEKYGAELVTTEMVIFEWIGSAEHPRFKEMLSLIK